MIRHEIERHLVQPQEMEIVLYLDPMLYWFNGHFAVQPHRAVVVAGDQHAGRKVYRHRRIFPLLAVWRASPS